jgi:Ser/Thr protein kinase RdoA (MazF antagonist)
VHALPLDAWGVRFPYRLSPLVHGTNNAVWRVESSSGEFVLRVYGNHADPQRLRFEQEVLTHLESAGLLFALPVPLPTMAGERCVQFESDDGEVLATLTHLIPGEPPRRDDLEQAVAAGEAIGALDNALERLEPEDASWGVSWRTGAHLAQCHPLVPDPVAAFEELPLEQEARRRLIDRYEWLTELMPALYARLPQQLVHEDTDVSNMLMVDSRVTGVLDFEFCSRDVRVMDLTVALSWWPVGRFGTGEEWPILRALAAGYARQVGLDAVEVEAIPALFHLRAYTSLIHRLGRYRQGVSPLLAVTDRVDAALEREDWLKANGGRLVETVRAERTERTERTESPT